MQNTVFSNTVLAGHVEVRKQMWLILPFAVILHIKTVKSKFIFGDTYMLTSLALFGGS